MLPITRYVLGTEDKDDVSSFLNDCYIEHTITPKRDGLFEITVTDQEDAEYLDSAIATQTKQNNSYQYCLCRDCFQEVVGLSFCPGCDDCCSVEGECESPFAGCLEQFTEHPD